MQHRELGKTVLYPHPVIGGGGIQCRGLVPLYEDLEHGGSSVKEGFEQPAIAPSEL
jgi:hypothetical protein